MQFKALHTFMAACVWFLIAVGCTPLSPEMLLTSDTLFQTSTLNALEAGQYDGTMTIGELKQHGDFGLGTFNALDGEMVVLDGQVYQIRDDGAARIAADEIQTPFAAVIFLTAETTATVQESLDCAAFQEQLDLLLIDTDAPFAIKVSGTFAQMQVRAPRRETPPYPPLEEALADQAIFDYENVRGDMVGFYLPAYMAGLNAGGYHFHFLSEDRQTGGHVLDCQTTDVSIEIDAIEQLSVEGL